MRANTLYSGLIRLHILHHAAQEPLYGLWLIEELARHGYRLSPGTIYPILHEMERAGYLRSGRREVNGRLRRVYSATSAGRKALGEGRQKVQELLAELFEEEE